MAGMTVNAFWPEKYRPKTLAEMVMPDDARACFEKMIKDGEIPHLLFAGNVGSGKTSLARILVAALDCECLAINASEQRGIDVVREKILPFSQVQAFRRWKICLLDEADSLTLDAQKSLRNMMEIYSSSTRFILTANHLDKIHDAIQSRCTLFSFQNVGRKAVRRFIEGILLAENIKYDKEILQRIVDDCYPDIRSTVKWIQIQSGTGVLNYVQHLDIYREIVKAIKKKDYETVRSLSQTAIDYTQALRYLYSDLAGETKDPAKAMIVIAEYMYRSSFIPDSEINFAACCVELMGLLP